MLRAAQQPTTQCQEQQVLPDESTQDHHLFLITTLTTHPGFVLGLALQIWAQHQPHHSVFTTAMEAAGFTVELHTHSYQAELPKATWLGMMRDRFWSTFSHCTQQELDQASASQC